MGKAPDNKKKKCQTVVPKTWPQFTGPGYKDWMTVGEAKRLWGEHLKKMEEVGRNPIVYRSKDD